MIIIGEKINSSRKSIRRAVETRDQDSIAQEAVKQAEAGANYLDVNCGTLDPNEEPEVLAWMVKIVQEATSLPVCIDSPNPKALAAGLAVHKGEAMINSISGESDRYNKILVLAKQYNARLVALCLDDNGIPTEKDKAIAVGEKLVSSIIEGDIPADRIYFDPLVRTLATGPNAVLDSLAIITALGKKFAGLHFVSGLSNVSYGLPERRHLNRAYVVMSIAAGLDAVIMDPTDACMNALIIASESLVNKDRFCMKYIKASKVGKLQI
jgi:cobalamin-dependent methionine synthase I